MKQTVLPSAHGESPVNAINMRDGVRLHVYEWAAIDGPPRGSVVLVHGLGEHLGRYAHVAARLNAKRWRVFGCDLRGHGQSQGPRGDAPERDTFLEDLAQVIDAVRAQSPV